jgi:glycosyltransferase involved in cell wall biosynthesis
MSRSILFVHNGTGLGGAPKALRYILQACVKEGYKCSVACMKCPETNPYFSEAGAEVILLESLPRYTNSTTNSFRPGSKQFIAEREFAKMYENYWFSILNSYGPFSLIFINSMVLCDLIEPSQKAGCKVVQVIRETAQSGSSLEIMKGIIGKANSILFISQYDRELFSLDSSKCFVVPDAVDPNLYSCSTDERLSLRRINGITEDDVVLLFTGGAGYIKGGELLLKCLCKVSTRKKIILLFAGYNGIVRPRSIKTLIKTILSFLSRSPRFQNERIARLVSILTKKGDISVKLLGYCNDIDKYFKVCDLCVVPYVIPHQAMPIFEAGMARIPCLVSDYPCFRDELVDDDNGYLIPVSETVAWARKIEELASDANKRKLMGLSNYNRAMDRHDIRKNEQKIMTLISQTVL